jgi:hypothetical protein
MSARYHVPPTVRFRTEPSAEQRARIERAVLEAIRGAVEDAAGHSAEVVTGTAPLPVAVAERFASARRTRDAYRVPSYQQAGSEEEIPLAQIGTEQDDVIVREPLPELTVMRAIGNRYFAIGGSPYVRSASVARALGWGRVLFGGRGFAVLEDWTTVEDMYVVAALTEPLTVSQLGGLSQVAPAAVQEAAGEWGRVGTEAAFFPLRDYGVVTVVTTDGTPLLTGDKRARWTPRTLLERVQATPARERLDPGAVRQATSLLVGSQSDDAEVRRLVSHMDRTVFAVIPWEERARYVKLLLTGWTGTEQKHAIIEIVHATRSTAELEAIFALVRQVGMYRQLFHDLDSEVYDLLQLLGELRGAGHLDSAYFVAVVGELFGPNPLDETERAVEAALGWLWSNIEGIAALITKPDELIAAIPHLVELLMLVTRAQVGDPKATLAIGQMMMRAGQGLGKAIRGAEYAEELGTSYGARGDDAKVTGDILERLRWSLFFEVLSWFVGVGEIRAAVASVGSGEVAAHVASVLGRLGRLGHAAETVAEAGRLERVLRAVGAAANVAEDAKLVRLAQLLPEEHAASLGRIAERVQLPEGASMDALRAALRGDRELLRAADEAEKALAAAARLEERAGTALSSDAAAGLRRILRDAPWDRQQLLYVIEQIPAGRIDEFMHALQFLHPEAFRSWSPGAFAAIAQRPAAIAFLREGGGVLFESTFRRSGQTWEGFERVVQGVEARRAELGDPAEVQRFLERLQRGEEAAFAEAAGGRLRSIARRGPSAEARTLLGGAVGDAGQALGELAEEERRAALLAADVEPRLARAIVAAEIEPVRARNLEELEAALRAAGTDAEEIARTRAALEHLNASHRALRTREEIGVALSRIQPLLEARPLEREAREILGELERRAASLRAGGRTDQADAVDRVARRLRGRLTGAGLQEQATALHEAVAKSPRLWRIAQGGGDETLRRLWLQWGSRARRSSFEEYVEVIARHYRGNVGEWEVAFRLGEDYVFLKAPDRLVTLPGTDLVAMPRGGGELLLIDNKALIGERVDAVDALTRNLPRNIERDLDEFAKLAADPHLPGELRQGLDRLRKARDEIAPIIAGKSRAEIAGPTVQAQIDKVLQDNQIRRVVSNAGGNVKGLSNELTEMGLQLLDLN